MLYRNEAQILLCLKRMSYQILEDYPEPPLLIGIKKRGYPIAARIRQYIAEELNREVFLGELNISLYQNDLSLINDFPIIHEVGIPFSIGGRDLILIDDVLNTGRTAYAAIDAVTDLGRPSRIRFACLADISRRELPLYADYTGWNIEISADEQLVVKVREIDGEDGIWIEKKGAGSEK
ncbi:MAG: bifunctional pyr operon transcriptional regulator/uracil phosphoribosyltransferase PyrR [Candidatus Wallbacteria bacterium]|nr:bifunctional pyr operon transcriptional regulator/uracil phosphoribosyltransferase PyrR [Candidatus Wallbacteria bacterium]